jgi:hypothetical protein
VPTQEKETVPTQEKETLTALTSPLPMMRCTCVLLVR